MKKYDHLFDFAFSVISPYRNPDNISAGIIRYHLIERAARLSDEEIIEACDCFDSFKIRETKSQRKKEAKNGD